MQLAVEHLLAEHRANDQIYFDEQMHTAAERQAKTLNAATRE